ncbi:uncharacterized protein PGTG_06029 [Puccinia graminis f. sp. tritici CRL 75-36-700-3]|uniref:Uncharacterized protein n=1 Tax=Puccinia graminis f. sp. tritici (strain CRL 75-36-700-3 / race SCCL) TaxID=418459 RepID=E3K5B2_PUCGT|nr:uncharacterized protein PGTG_06029 [Puccinia graminis f. sp. tritici CRL 75-36-700-3]EFP79708.2 hypothetical protein PGTG_06029 [Puccinia graminis f. sp. tritici CRL 75-36-700-3]
MPPNSEGLQQFAEEDVSLVRRIGKLMCHRLADTDRTPPSRTKPCHLAENISLPSWYGRYQLEDEDSSRSAETVLSQFAEKEIRWTTADGVIKLGAATPKNYRHGLWRRFIVNMCGILLQKES